MLRYVIGTRLGGAKKQQESAPAAAGGLKNGTAAATFASISPRESFRNPAQPQEYQGVPA
jgi:hypothetical protein